MQGAGMILSLEGSMERSVRHKFRGFVLLLNFVENKICNLTKTH